MLKKTLAIVGLLFAVTTACLPSHAYIDYNGDGTIDADEKLRREIQVTKDVVAAQKNNSHSSTDCYGEMQKHWPSHLHGWAQRVIQRESRGVATAQNPRSSAAGCFQLMHSYHANKYPANCKDRYNAHCNVQAAWKLYQQDPTAWNF